MAIDPICGMTVDEATALSVERDGETYYFCCEHCREKFVAGDDSPIQMQPPRSGSTAEYYCPMCERVESDTPEDCLNCGMDLELKFITADEDDEPGQELRSMTLRFWVAAALARLSCCWRWHQCIAVKNDSFEVDFSSVTFPAYFRLAWCRPRG